MSRAPLMLFLFMAAIAASAQAASDLAARYGEPDAERFLVRSEVTLTARYAVDRTACEIVIQRMHSIIPRDEPTKYMRPEVMTEIIDEVLPETSRSKLLLGIVTKSACNDFETKDYENVTVHRFRHRCHLPNPEIEGAATITRKNPSCTAIDSALPGVQKP